jgi:transposase
MIKRHLEGILAHWRNKTTNAFLEALKSVFSAVKRKAQRFLSTYHHIAVLDFRAAKLRTPTYHGNERRTGGEYQTS